MTYKKRALGVLEKYFLPNPQWQEGYKDYHKRLGRPTAWLFLVKDTSHDIIRLDRKGAAFNNAKLNPQEIQSRNFHSKYAEQLIKDEDRLNHWPLFYKDTHGKEGVIIPLKHLGRIKAMLFLIGLQDHQAKTAADLRLFEHFTFSQVELGYKTFELNNFYETVHPRALALSTMHSVHRVISSSLRLNELLPRIGRLSAQVLKAKGCSIMLVDSDHKYLLPFFAFGEDAKFTYRHRIRIGRGLQGRIAATGEFHLTNSSIAVPFIEDDIVGVITLWRRIDKQPFSKIDLEILKSLSEQAVVAIKNAQLFEETEKLTWGSIKTINELLEVNFEGDRLHLSLFSLIVMELGKEMALSSRELTHLEKAILLLDTGTLGLPVKFWKKKGKLTKREYDQIKRIPLRGANLLKSISSLKPVIPIILYNHERYDGKGYPQGLKGEEIPIGARIVSVVNSFLAMISKRVYRAKFAPKKAVLEIEKNSGTQFDPKVVECFMTVIQKEEILAKIYELAKN